MLGPGWISAAQSGSEQSASDFRTSGVSTPAAQPLPHRPDCTFTGVPGPLYQLPCSTLPSAAAPVGAWTGSAPQPVPHSGQQQQQLRVLQLSQQPHWPRPTAGFSGEALHLRQQHSGPVLQHDLPFSSVSSGAAMSVAAVALPASVGVPSATDVPAQPAGAMDSTCSESDNSASFGWFSKCRGCCQLTAGEMELRGQVVPLCRGCSRTLMKKAAPDQEASVGRIVRSHQVLLQREAAAAASSGAGGASL